MVATAMAKKRESCTYSTTKLDSEVLPLARAAASLNGKRIQEWLSDLANEAAARTLNRDPIVRREPPPRRPKDAD